MKTIKIKNVYAVGMHHWDPRQLEIGSIYFLKLEENPRDQNTVQCLKIDRPGIAKPTWDDKTP